MSINIIKDINIYIFLFINFCLLFQLFIILVQLRSFYSITLCLFNHFIFLLFLVMVIFILLDD